MKRSRSQFNSQFDRRTLVARSVALGVGVGMAGGAAVFAQDASPAASPAVDTGRAFEKYPEPVTLRIPQTLTPNFGLPEGDSAEDNRVTRYILDRVNVKIEHPWEVTAGDQYGQKVDLDIASGDIPDAFKVNAKQLARLAEADLLEDLSPYWDEFASPLVKEVQASADGVALERATIDGKLLAVPGVVKDGDAVPFLWVRSDWLEALGLELPSTLEEVKAVAKAFVDNDASGQGDTIGIGAEALWADSLGPIFNARKSIPCEWVPNAEGEPTYGTIEPETKEGLADVAALYEEGLIDREFAALNSDKLVEKVTAGKVGIVFGPWWYSDWPLKLAINNVPEARWEPVLAPLDAEGKASRFYASNTGSFLVVRKGYEHPEAAIKLANIQAEYEAPVDMKAEKDLTYGDFPDAQVLWASLWPSVSMTRADWLVFHATNAAKAVETGNTENLASNEVKIVELLAKFESGEELTADDWGFGTAWAKGVPLLGDERIVQVREVYQSEDVLAEEQIWSTIVAEEDQTILQILTGERSVDDFDGFVDTWNSLGGQDILAKIRDAAAAE